MPLVFQLIFSEVSARLITTSQEWREGLAQVALGAVLRGWRGGERKTNFSRHVPVVALIQRGGKMYTRVVSNVSQKNLGQCLNECVDKSAIVNTDNPECDRSDQLGHASAGVDAAKCADAPGRAPASTFRR
jgi:predicted metal-binding protein